MHATALESALSTRPEYAQRRTARWPDSINTRLLPRALLHHSLCDMSACRLQLLLQRLHNRCVLRRFLHQLALLSLHIMVQVKGRAQPMMVVRREQGCTVYKSTA